jgi:hypothetical protein
VRGKNPGCAPRAGPGPRVVVKRQVRAGGRCSSPAPWGSAGGDASQDQGPEETCWTGQARAASVAGSLLSLGGIAWHVLDSLGR